MFTEVSTIYIASNLISGEKKMLTGKVVIPDFFNKC